MSQSLYTTTTKDCVFHSAHTAAKKKTDDRQRGEYKEAQIAMDLWGMKEKLL